MSQVELARGPLAAQPAGETLLTGWGRTAPSCAHVLRPHTGQEAAALLADAAEAGRTVIARGAGRGYGDAAQNGGGTVLDATGLCWIADLDPVRHTVRAGAGTPFAELLLYLAEAGLTLPVVPGTRHLTVGGAIAADVHGKNHLADGSFARHVESFTLCTPAHGPGVVSRESDRELFDATLGGMGLTGVVLEATLRLAPLNGTCAVADIDRTETIEAALALMGGVATHRYAIAWVDLLHEFGRAVVTRSDESPAPAPWRRRGVPQGHTRPAVGPRADTACAAGPDAHTRLAANPSARGPCAAGPDADAPFADAPGGARGRFAATAGPGTPFALTPRVCVPLRCPPGLLRPAAVRVFNELHWRRSPRQTRGRTLSMSAQLFPLDVVGDWNRLYGPAGLVQYQFVVPSAAQGTLLRVLYGLRARRAPMYLAVIKRFGTGTGAPLSFPIEGWTVAIDMPADAPGLAAALDEADELVAGAGGRVYLAKDARMRAETLVAMYPDLDRLAQVRARVDPGERLRSDLARRLGLCA
jgi:decaprenylphospho-beta-D-ribofuranose 2-oxidase